MVLGANRVVPTAESANSWERYVADLFQLKYRQTCRRLYDGRLPRWAPHPHRHPIHHASTCNMTCGNVFPMTHRTNPSIALGSGRGARRLAPTSRIGWVLLASRTL